MAFSQAQDDYAVRSVGGSDSTRLDRRGEGEENNSEMIEQTNLVYEPGFGADVIHSDNRILIEHPITIIPYEGKVKDSVDEALQPNLSEDREVKKLIGVFGQNREGDLLADQVLLALKLTTSSLNNLSFSRGDSQAELTANSLGSLVKIGFGRLNSFGQRELESNTHVPMPTIVIFGPKDSPKFDSDFRRVLTEADKILTTFGVGKNLLEGIAN